MYKLILTHDERKAIDFVGGRYATGDPLYSLLWSFCQQEDNPYDWDSEEDIEFHIPEHIAWEIRDLSAMEQDLWPCFSYEFTMKMSLFINKIV